MVLRRPRRALYAAVSRSIQSIRRAAVETLEDRRLMSVSLVSGIGDTGGNGPSGQAGDEQTGLSISQDGRYVVFASAASNLVAGDTNGKTDIFVKDLQTGTITLASATPGGAAGNGDSGEAVGSDEEGTGYAISGNGRYVVFASLASDLVANDANNGADLFLRDLQSGVTTLLTVNAAGTGSGSSISTVGEELVYGRPAISDDGRFVAFSTTANDLVAGQENDGPQPDTFVRDTQNNTTVHLTKAFNGGAAAGNGSMTQSISADGRYVVFVSQDQVLENGPNLLEQVYVYDTTNQTRSLVSTNAAGTGGGAGHSTRPRISADGRHVVFQSNAGDLVAGQVRDPGNIGSDYDLFYRNLDTGTTRLISGVAGSATHGGNNGSGPGAISGDGKFIAFYSNADNLVSAGISDDNDADDLFLFDTTANALTLVSAKTGGGSTASQGAVSITSDAPVLSRDGRYLVFESGSSDLVAGDQNPLIEMFVRDNTTGSLRRIFQGVTANGVEIFAGAERPAISADGAKLVFISNAFGLPGNTSTSTLPQPQVYLDTPGSNNPNNGDNNGTIDIVPALTAALPSAAIAGEKTKASATVAVTNRGTGKLSGPVTIKLYASTDGSVDAGDAEITTITKKLTLKAGQTKQVKVKIGSFPTVADGSYFMVADVSGGGISESSTSNNQAASTNTVTIAAPFVDLSGQASPPKGVKAGRKATLPLTITNGGNSLLSGASSVRVTLTPSGGGSPTTIDVPASLKLKPGASKTFKLKFAAPPTAGSYTVSAAVDAGNAIAESDEANNTAGPVPLSVTA